VKAVEHGLSCITVFVGLRGSNKDNELHSQNHWLISRENQDPDKALDEWMAIVSIHATGHLCKDTSPLRCTAPSQPPPTAVHTE